MSADPRSNEIHFRTNLDENIALDTAHPILLRSADDSQDFRPYVEVRNGLLANYRGQYFTSLLNMLKRDQMAGLEYGATSSFSRLSYNVQNFLVTQIIS